MKETTKDRSFILVKILSGGPGGEAPPAFRSVRDDSGRVDFHQPVGAGKGRDDDAG